MRIACRLSRGRVAAGRQHDLHLLVRFSAPAAPPEGARPPIAIVPVVDVSGSMEGSKLTAVKQALERLADHLLPGDRVGLVAFDAAVVVALPLGELTEARRAELRRAIQGLRAGSRTNLSGGLLQGLAEARRAVLPPGRRARVVLLTDGLANEGPALGHEQLVALVRARADGVAVSAFGYGDDCDQSVLGEMAHAGDGSYAYIRNDDLVLTAFGRELGGLVSTYATDCRVRIVAPGAPPIEARLGDLLHQGELSTVAKVAAPSRGPSQAVPLASVELRYCDGQGSERSVAAAATVDYVEVGRADAADDPEVVRAVDEQGLRESQEEAEGCARQGDFARAQRLILERLAVLRDPTLIAFARDALLPCYEDRRRYTSTSSTRAGSLTALRGGRTHVSDPAVAGAFNLGPTSGEAEMERAFRAPAGGGTPPPKK